MQDFLNPKSMVTPGVSGAVIMAIASALWVNFELPQKWTALLLSFLVCSFIFSSLVGAALAGMPPLWRLVLYVFNSLIVFAIATGTNVGLNAAAKRADKVVGSVAASHLLALVPVSQARAQGDASAPEMPKTDRPVARIIQPAANASAPSEAVAPAATSAEIQRLMARIRELERQNAVQSEMLKTRRAEPPGAALLHGPTGVGAVVAASAPAAPVEAAKAAEPPAVRRRSFIDPWF
jgi:hypothetical protein